MRTYLQTLVDFYPVTDNQEAVLTLLDYVANHLKRAGMKVERLSYDGINSLYASTTGLKHSKLLLQGHIDVVPGKQSFREVKGTLYGRGVFDMLFATASFMQLIDDIGQDLAKYDLAIMLTGDEEHGGMSGVAKILEDGYTTDVCILPDAGDGFGTLSIGAKGVYHAKIKINGRSHHGSRPWEGDGAAGKLVKFLTELSSLFDTSDKDNSTLTVSMLEAGETLNQGPSSAVAGIDIRYKDKADLECIIKGLKQLLKEFDGQIDYLHTGSDFQLDTDNPLVRQFIELYQREIGREVTFMRAHGSSDARFFSEKDMPVIMLRPDGGGAHGDNEWLSASSYEQFYTLLKKYTLVSAKK
ncbi:MAG: M20/M25/M40 family metallo-hydrolase [Candidatus Microsaccharimonas sp.]